MITRRLPMCFMRSLAVALSMALLTEQSDSQTITSRDPDVARALKMITPELIYAHTAFLSDDLLEGRGPATRGDLLTTHYIAMQYKAMGLEPAGENGTYFQSVPIVGVEGTPLSPLSASIGDRTATFVHLEEFVANSPKLEPSVVVDAEVVFVGYGIQAPAQDWDDYKDVDVRGKILLMMNDDPKSDDPNFFGGRARTYYGRWTYKYEIAAEKGAVGAIIVHTDESAGYPWQVVRSGWSGIQYWLDDRGDVRRRLQVEGWLTEDAARKLVALSGDKLDRLMASAESRRFRPEPLGVVISIELAQRVERLSTRNVLGLLRGSDPKLQHEVIVHSAHHDHFGIGKPVNGDSIYNGALDNAVGVSIMLGAAKAFATLEKKPKRSMLFLACAAEEAGLLGSKYYAQNPTVPAENLIANFNTDGPNIYAPTREMTFIGAERSTLGETIERVLKSQNLRLTPDQFPEQGYFFRSDHINFAKIGVPAVHVKTGEDFIGKPASWGKEMMQRYTKENYHQPSDTIAHWWDFSAAVQQAQIVFLCELEVANAPKAPEWSPGDEFAGRRPPRR